MSSERSSGWDFSIGLILLQFGLIVLALTQWNQPVLQPVKLLVVLVHEMSHGLMALATGGTVQAIHITPLESGSCHTTGGNTLLIISAGYLGSMFFGGVLLAFSRTHVHSMVIYTILAFLLFAAAVTVIEDPYSKKFTIVVAFCSLLVGVIVPGMISTLLLRGIGTISCLYTLIDIYNDILSKAARDVNLESDASVFASLTKTDPSTIGLAWLLVSLIYFVITLKLSVAEGTPSPSPAPAG
jgi:hypothetical protein